MSEYDEVGKVVAPDHMLPVYSAVVKNEQDTIAGQTKKAITSKTCESEETHYADTAFFEGQSKHDGVSEKNFSSEYDEVAGNVQSPEELPPVYSVVNKQKH